MCESNPVYVHLWVGSNIEQNTRNEKVVIIVIMCISIICGNKWIGLFQLMPSCDSSNQCTIHSNLDWCFQAWEGESVVLFAACQPSYTLNINWTRAEVLWRKRPGLLIPPSPCQLFNSLLG